MRFSSFLENPVVPITTFFFCFDAILRISNVHLGTVKSIITFAFLNEFIELNPGFIPDTFLFIFLFSVNATSLKILFFFADLMSC